MSMAGLQLISCTKKYNWMFTPTGGVHGICILCQCLLAYKYTCTTIIVYPSHMGQFYVGTHVQVHVYLHVQVHVYLHSTALIHLVQMYTLYKCTPCTDVRTSKPPQECTIHMCMHDVLWRFHKQIHNLILFTHIYSSLLLTISLAKKIPFIFQRFGVPPSAFIRE